jgi:hypothetical protein
MKRLFVGSLLLVGLLVFPLVAQVTFGIGPGVQYSGGRQHPLSLAYDRTSRCTLFGEMWVNIPIGWILSVRPGLMYADKEFNATIVYSGRDHRTTPGTFKAGWAELPVLLVAQPVPWFHIGGGGYAALATYKSLRYTPLTDVLYESVQSSIAVESVRTMCCPPPPPPPPPKPKPKPIPNGDPVISYRFDWGYMVVVGIDWKIKCPTWTLGNSIELGWSRGLAKVFSTHGRWYSNEVLTASYTLWF